MAIVTKCMKCKGSPVTIWSSLGWYQIFKSGIPFICPQCGGAMKARNCPKLKRRSKV